MSKDVRKLFRRFAKAGLVVTARKVGYTVSRKGSSLSYFTHGGDASYHDLRRDVPRMFGLDPKEF